MPSSTTGVASADLPQLRVIDVDTDHLVTVASQARQRNRTDIAQAENADLIDSANDSFERRLSQHVSVGPRVCQFPEVTLRHGEAALDNRSSRLHRARPGVVRKHPRAPASASRFRSLLSSKMRSIASIYCAGVSATRKCSPSTASTPRAAASAHYTRNASCHCLENFVLGSTSDVERRDHQCRTIKVGPHVRNRAGHGTPGKSPSLTHGGEGSAPTM